METGVAGNNGVCVQNLVAADHKTALARAPALHRQMAAKNAEEKVNDHVFVTISLVPVS